MFRSLVSLIRDVFGIFRKHLYIEIKNVLGLTIGFALVMFISLYVRYEMTYDHHQNEANRIYRLYSYGNLGNDSISTAATPLPSIQVFEKMDSLLENYTEIIPGSNKLVSYRNKSFSEERFFYSDTSFFSIFNVRFLSGNSMNALIDSFSVVISQSVAEKYFGHENPMGKLLKLDNGLELEITGVFEDVTGSSHFHFDFIASSRSIDKLFKNDTTGLTNWKQNWLVLNAYHYVRLKKDVSPSRVELAFNKLNREEMLVQLGSALTASEMDKNLAQIKFALQPILKIHLKSHLQNELEENSNMEYVLVPIGLALFIFFITVVSFSNLSTVRIRDLMDESQRRKLFGGSINEIILSRVITYVLLSITAFFLSIVILELLFPFLNNYLSLGMSINEIREPHYILWGLIIICLVGLVVGLIPRLYLKKQCVPEVELYNQTIYKLDKQMRGSFLFLQIVTTIVLVACAFTIQHQLKNVKNYNLGYNPNDVLVIKRGYVLGDKLDDFKKELLRKDEIQDVSACSFLPGDGIGKLSLREKGQKDQLSMWSVNFVDNDFIKTMQIPLTSDSLKTMSLISDSVHLIVNQTAYNSLKGKGANESQIEFIGLNENKNELFDVNTVVKDFYYGDLKSAVEPMALLTISMKHYQFILLRYKSSEYEKAVESVRGVWNSYTGNQPFDYFQLNSHVLKMYEKDKQLYRLILILSFFSVWMCLLNLIGYVVFYLSMKDRDFQIRKLQGAKIGHILFELFLKVKYFIITGILILVPLYVLISSKWYSLFVVKFPISTVHFLFILIAFGMLIGIIAATQIARYFKRISF